MKNHNNNEFFHGERVQQKINITSQDREDENRIIEELNYKINERELLIRKLIRDKESIIDQLRKKTNNVENEVEKLLNKRIVQLENEYAAKGKKLRYEIDIKKRTLDEEINKTKIEMERYTKDHEEKLQRNSSDFVKYTVDDLVSREGKLSKISSIWSCAGAAVLFIGLVVTIIISIKNFSSTSEAITWPYLVYFSFKGIIVLTIIGLFTRYNFINSGNYMQEAIKLANQIHKIRFGQFYIETYGATATWEEVKEAFANWNGDEKSTWEKSIQYDEFNNGLSMLSSAIDKIKNIVPSGKEKSKEVKEIKSEKN